MESVNSNDLMYKYWAYGLKIHSEICLPELMHLDSESADVTIICNDVSLPNDKVINEGLDFKVTKDSIYKFWDEIGKFKITKDGIVIDYSLGIDKITLRNFIMGTVFATLLRLRGLFVLHASSVNINGSAVAFSGFKGYGKSTTAMAFYNAGYPIIADDYVTIEFDNDVPLISPGFPSLRLSNKSREYMGLNLDKNILDEDILDKTYESLVKSFSSSKIPLKKIYIIKKAEECNIVPLKPNQAFIEIIKNTFGIQLFSKLELPNNFFQCERIVKDIDVSILEIPDSLEILNDVVKIVEKDMRIKL